MKNSERAKIFAPFSPLKSFGEALREKEIVRVPKTELAEERIAELDEILHRVEVGSEVSVVYYDNGIYEKITGLVSGIDSLAKTLSIAKRTILFDNIYDIKL
ncbi:MAG: YolD-like family protein [Oscillospiraceae bacterium]|nr:YolD-like family protein [Oscillospiraceae bacterium]